MKKYSDIVGDGGSDIVGQVTKQLNKLNERLNSIKYIVAVMSGKGGVGKSSVAVNLSSALSILGHSVGILDADVNGPAIAKMTGTHDQETIKSGSSILPVKGFLDLKVMSMDLFLNDDNTPVVWEAASQENAHAWRGLMEATAVREFAADTEWGALDYLIIDLPPGTDKLPNLVDVLPWISGAIIVTIPTGISQFVVGKSIQMTTEFLNIPVIGLIENMSGRFCPNCGEPDPLFPKGNVAQQAKNHNVPFLGSIPFDVQIANAADEGISYMAGFAKMNGAQAIREITEKVIRFLN